MKQKTRRITAPFNLQMFAGDGDGTGGNGSGAGAEGNDGGNQPMSFDVFLKLEGNQAEFDRRVQKATTTALNNAQEKWRALTDDKLSEAEKLAKMTKEEKAEYKAKKLEKELSDLKKANAISDMAKTARRMLADQEINVSDELLAHLVSESADDTKATVESFAKLYKDAVQEEVKSKLKGSAPRAGSGSTGVTKEQILAIKNPAERQRMIAENIALFE